MKKWDKEKLKNILLLGICFVLVGFVFFYNILGGHGRTSQGGEKTQEENNEQEEYQEKEFTWHEEYEAITQAEACRLLSFLHYTQAQQRELPMEEAVDAIADGEEAIYLNAALAAGYLTAAELAPQKELTCGDFRSLLVALCKVEGLDYLQLIEQLPKRLSHVTENDALYLGEFLTVYELCLAQLSEAPVEKKELYVFELGENEVLYDELGARYTYSGCQDYSGVFANLLATQPQEDQVSQSLSGREEGRQREMSDYQDSVLEVLCAGSTLLYVRSQQVKEITLPNVWLLAAKGDRVSAYINGVYKEYQTEFPLQGSLEQIVCDLVIKNGVIREVTLKQDVIRGKVLMTANDQIEVEGYGRLELAENFRIYKIYGELSLEKTSRILVGYSITDFVVADGKICAALITEKLKAENIRVLISTNSYTARYHASVELTADREFTVTRGENVRTYAAGETVTFLAEEEYETAERVKIETVGGEGKITLLNVRRSSGTPSYRGTIEVSAAKEGLIVINELSLEEYLYAVIPSEMPTSYGAEALKVQAVCARSYAYNQLVASRFREYGAHVDDSVSCQVYNNIAENEASILAVKETYGLVAASEGSIITAYYFSTSCGHTASYEEVWEGAVPVTYLTGCLQNETQDAVDFSDEEAFRAFLMQNTPQTFEQEISWYRWQVTLPAAQLMEQAGAADKMDTLTKAAVTKRGSSGIALELTLYGTKGNAAVEVVISYQTAIRKALAPKTNPVSRQMGSAVSDMTLLPSAFFVLDEVKEGEALTAITLYGGGYGHGTGMSQNGVKCLADTGKSYEEIIAHYYKGTDLIFLYD